MVRTNPRDMNPNLINKRVAILAADGFEQAELEQPMTALERVGADVCIVSPQDGKIQGMNHLEKGDSFDVDLSLADAHAADFDALLIPGGLANPDTLRSTPEAVNFVREFADAGKPIASICHGPWVLIEAGIVNGRRMTSWPAIQTDIRNAGGEWVDQEVVVDNGLVTSRKPGDLRAFNSKMIEEFSEGEHPVMTAAG
jgi:protease I